MSAKIAIDAMGGDNAPFEIIKGTIDALKTMDFKALLVGDEVAISSELAKYEYNKDKIEIIPSQSVIENCEQPTVAIKEKKDSSMVVALNLVKEGRADAIISAGNTGALLTGSTLIIGRIKGIKRPCLGVTLPTKKGYTLLVDCGANVDAKPENLLQFAQMGYVYYKEMFDKENTTVGLINIGEEETKGNEQVKATYELLKNSSLNFIGNVEGRDIPLKGVDVVVADAFVGNVVLKTFEGLGKMFTDILKESLTEKFLYKIGALLSMGALNNMRAKFDYKTIGGAPFLGLNSLVVKAHGSSDARAFKGAINQCLKFKEKDIINKIAKNVQDVL
ncbi:MAG: phosphate acyltransferase PlsX [Lachnospirales bacterium]